jgi:hypothetical protein
MIASTRAAISAFCGNGMPCVMMVDSSATTALPLRSALATSGSILGWAVMMFQIACVSAAFGTAILSFVGPDCRSQRLEAGF